MQFPRMRIRNQNDFTLNWDNTFDNSTLGNAEERCVFKLQICDHFKEWKTIYCGSKTEFKVDSLAPCTSYSFRIKREGDDEWLYFKAATEDVGPYTSVMHISRALKLGKTSVIRKIANTKPLLLNAENKENKTPIIQAIEIKDLQILHLLIMLGANVNKPLRSTQRTPLMVAVYRGQLQAAALLIEKVMLMDIRTLSQELKSVKPSFHGCGYVNLPFHESDTYMAKTGCLLRYKKLECVTRVANPPDLGANINSTDVNGLNILHHAVDSNNLENVKFALETKLNINLPDYSGWTPLLRAVILQCKEGIIDYLLANGADSKFRDKNGFDFKKHLEIIG